MTYTIKGKEFSSKGRYVCIPVTSRTLADLKGDLSTIIEKEPDFIEWRADYFHEMDQLDLAISQFRLEASQFPLIYTLRDITEGGVIPYSIEERLGFLERIADSETFDLIDMEWQAPEHLIKRAKALRLDKNFKLILSNHDFDKTPEQNEIIKRLTQMKRAGADIIKVAYFANCETDALLLLEASLKSSELNKIPQIALSMGPMGTMTRIFGFQYGSMLSYAVGVQSSANGQLPIEILRLFWDNLHSCD